MVAQSGIIILSVSAGAGHVIAGRGLEQAFRAAAPDIPVTHVDMLALTSRFFRHLYAGGYETLVRYAPTVMGWIYDAMDRGGGDLGDRLRIAIQDWHKGPLLDYLRAARPRLVVSTHFLPAEVIAQARRAGETWGAHAIVTTDYETHRLWTQEPADRYYAATDLGAALLTSWGAPRDKILTTGIPVRTGFGTALPRDEAARRRGLDPRRPIILLLCSGLGDALPVVLLDQLLRLPPEVQLVVLVGRNAPLQARLERRTEPLAPGRVHIVGFSEVMHEWMRAADLAVGKPGGLTVSESLACGLPLAIVKPYPGQELRNADYLLEHGAALRVHSPRLLAYRMRTVLADRVGLESLRAATHRIARPEAAAEIARDALTLIR
jgi:processive 1,2-diacylglycerol beta-glucosyltransferase